MNGAGSDGWKFLTFHWSAVADQAIDPHRRPLRVRRVAYQMVARRPKRRQAKVEMPSERVSGDATELAVGRAEARDTMAISEDEVLGWSRFGYYAQIFETTTYSRASPSRRQAQTRSWFSKMPA